MTPRAPPWRLAAYLVATLAATVVAGLVLIGPFGWSWGLLAWACASAMAILLYFEQKGHPWTLVVPGVLLACMLLLKLAVR